VTSVVEGTSHGARGGRGLWVALALSLTLNIFVIGGLVWPIVTGGPPRQQGPIERLIIDARRLDLTPDQKAALGIFGAAARKANLGLREANTPLMRDIWTEIGKPQPDAARIATITDQVLENRRAFQKAMSTNLLAFVTTLSPEQRQHFAELQMQRPEGPHPGAGPQATR